MTDIDELCRRADAAIAADHDHLSGLGEKETAWLVAQLACWPTRINPANTTNIRFLMVSAAALIREQAATIARLGRECSK